MVVCAAGQLLRRTEERKRRQNVLVRLTETQIQLRRIQLHIGLSQTRRLLCDSKTLQPCKSQLGTWGGDNRL